MCAACFEIINIYLNIIIQFFLLFYSGRVKIDFYFGFALKKKLSEIKIINFKESYKTCLFWKIVRAYYIYFFYCLDNLLKSTF